VPHLRERGWNLHFWVARPSPLYDELERRRLSVAGAPRPFAFSLRALQLPPGVVGRGRQLPSYLARFRAFARTVSPDLVHANSLFSVPEAAVARLWGVPSLLHVHEMMPAGRKGMIAPHVARAVASQVVAVSEANAAELTVNGQGPAIVYEGAPVPERPVDLRRNPRPFVVGTVGVIGRRKGSDIFLEAAREVIATGADIEFRMVGACTDVFDAKWGGTVIERAKKAGIAHQERADVVSEMRKWDAFVLPSRRDPFPIVMLEAMATGLPVIGARVDGIAEQITESTGVLVPTENAPALARAIGELAVLPYERRVAMGSAAHERVKAHFTVEHQASRMERVYLNALGTGDGSVRRASDAG